jgi:hypothetical protein
LSRDADADDDDDDIGRRLGGAEFGVRAEGGCRGRKRCGDSYALNETEVPEGPLSQPPPPL